MSNVLRVGEWFLFNTRWVIVQLYQWEKMLFLMIFDDIVIRESNNSDCTQFHQLQQNEQAIQTIEQSKDHGI